MNGTPIPVVIQATYSSRIFAGKGLVRLYDDVTVLSYLVDRIRSHWRGKIILTTSEEAEDDALVAEAQRCNIACVREKQHDLVRRLWKAIERKSCRHFIRVYGNYPLLDVKAMAAMVDAHLSDEVDYSYNDHHEGVPLGMGCEVISKASLKSLLSLDLTDEEREIGTLYIRQNSGRFNILRWTSRHADPNVRLVFDTEQDLRLLRDIISHVTDPDAPSVLAYLAAHPLLAASNQESPPQEVGTEKLLLHPTKLGAMRGVTAEAPDLSYPVSVELSLTNRCNLACIYCSDLGLRMRESMASELDKDVLFRLFDDLREGGTQGVVLEGGGEPTIHPDFDEIVRRLASIGLPAGLITNGTAKLSPEILASLEWIRVSIDASTPQEWAAIKGQDRFLEVLSNLRDYARHCPTVGVGYVVTNDNMSDIETFVQRIRQHDVAYVQFRPVVDAPELAPTNLSLQYLRRYETSTFAVLLDGMTANAPSANAGLPCRAHSLTTVISGDGNVFMCGRLNIHDWLLPIGNIRENSFREIWHGEARAKHSRQMLDPAFCSAHCPQCRLTTFNCLLDRLDRTRTQHFI